MEYKRIPNEYKVGGQKIEVHIVERCDNNDLGECCYAGGFIEIANTFNKDERQTEDSKRNTFYHEMIHTILQSMGEYELNGNEKFVNCFAGFLTEAMGKAVFEEGEL